MKGHPACLGVTLWTLRAGRSTQQHLFPTKSCGLASYHLRKQKYRFWQPNSLRSKHISFLFAKRKKPTRIYKVRRKPGISIMTFCQEVRASRWWTNPGGAYRKKQPNSHTNQQKQWVVPSLLQTEEAWLLNCMPPRCHQTPGWVRQMSETRLPMQVTFSLTYFATKDHAGRGASNFSQYIQSPNEKEQNKYKESRLYKQFS